MEYFSLGDSDPAGAALPVHRYVEVEDAPDQLTAQTSLSARFLYLISVCEILAALGLVLQRLFKTATWLTPLASALLVVIMVGATVSTLEAGPIVAGGGWRVAR
jgi:hypothetical protein